MKVYLALSLVLGDADIIGVYSSGELASAAILRSLEEYKRAISDVVLDEYRVVVMIVDAS